MTTETHHSKKDIHYHILIQTKEGLSKNTYRKDIEKLFPEFEKAHAIKREGVKSLANTINYIIKEIPPMTALNFFEKGTTDELLITNITPHELKTNAKKSLIIKDIQVIQQIIEYKEIKEWARRTLRTVRLYTRKKRIIRALWEVSRKFLGIEDPFKKLIELSQLDYTKHVATLQDRYGWREVHYALISHIIFLLLCRRGYENLPTKTKIPIIVGPPNRGKSSLIKKFTEVFGEEAFFEVGLRGGDFTGLEPRNKPILVFDDVVGEENSKKWDTNIILKILAREFKIRDNKYEKLTTIKYTGAIVVTNEFRVLGKSPAMQVRTKEYVLVKQVNWAEIPIEIFKITVIMVLENILAQQEGDFGTWTITQILKEDYRPTKEELTLNKRYRRNQWNWKHDGSRSVFQLEDEDTPIW